MKLPTCPQAGPHRPCLATIVISGKISGKGMHAVRRICLPLAIFLAYLTVVGIGTGIPRYSLYFRIADSTLVLIHLAFLAFMFVLVVRDRWGARCHGSSGPTMLQRVLAWITDDRTFPT